MPRLLRIAYFDATISAFKEADDDAILGVLTRHHGFSLEHQQRYAWVEQIRILKRSLSNLSDGHIFFEFSIPRMGKRADVIFLHRGIVFVVEFKVGSGTFDRYAIDQVEDYALDLKNFHRGSHSRVMVPILVATEAAPNGVRPLVLASDGVAKPICASPSDIAAVFSSTVAVNGGVKLGQTAA